MSTSNFDTGLVQGRECGACSLCCKVLHIPYLDPPKAGGNWCRHCTPGRGCAIWQERPQGCADYHCLWRRNASLSELWRPDKSGFLLSQQAPHLPIEVIVDPGKPNAWRASPYYENFKRIGAELLAQNLFVLIIVGARQWIVLPHEDVPVPSEHINGDVRLLRDAQGRWQVEFLGKPAAS